MKKIFTISNKKEQDIDFGIAISKEEIQNVYSFRYMVYLEKGHICKKKDQKDIDYFDEKKLCRYYIAKYNNNLIGTLRIIYSNPSPTKALFYEFTVPDKIANIKDENILEVGRLISRPFVFSLKIPRHLIMIGLFHAIGVDQFNNKYQAGYGSIKKSVYDKLRAIGLPVNEITSALPRKIINLRGVKNFFKESKDAPHPVYYIIDEVRDYLNGLFNNVLVFKKNSPKHYVLRSKIMFYLYFVIKASKNHFKIKLGKRCE